MFKSSKIVPSPAATAQAYPAPVQAPPFQRPALNKICSEVAKRWNGLLLLSITTITVLIYFVLVYSGVISLWPPTSPKLGINSLSVSSFNISGSQITASWEVEFLRTKPEPTSGSNVALLSIFYKNQLPSEASVHRIDISRNSIFSVNAAALAKRIEDPKVVDAIARDWSELGIVPFTVRLLDTSYIIYHDGMSYHDAIYSLDVTCPDIMVDFSNRSSSHGTMFVQHAPDINSSDQQEFSRCSTFLYQNGYKGVIRVD